MLTGFKQFQTGHVASTHNNAKSDQILFATKTWNIVKFKNKNRTM